RDRPRRMQGKGIDLSPDGRTLVLRGWPPAISLWDLETGKELRPLVGHTGPINHPAWSPDGKALATGSWDSTVRLWDAATGQCQYVLRTLPTRQGVAISPRGHYRGTPRAERFLTYVAQTEQGQQTLTPEDFATKYGWKNKPEKVRLTAR